jgi:hypothetical protein
MSVMVCSLQTLFYNVWVEKINGHNFHIWKIKMGFALCRKLFTRLFQQSLLQLCWKFKKETLAQKGEKMFWHEAYTKDRQIGLWDAVIECCRHFASSCGTSQD